MTPRLEPPREIDFTPVTLRPRRDAGPAAWTPCPSRGVACGPEVCARCPRDRGLSFDPIDATWYRLCWRAAAD